MISQSCNSFHHFSENSINFGRLLLLNDLSKRPQLGLILKSYVCSLKWALVEVICSIHLGDISSQSCKGLCYFSDNNIDFGWLLLLNELSKRPQLRLILKSYVCFLKWPQVEVICSIRLGDMSFRSYFIKWKLLELQPLLLYRGGGWRSWVNFIRSPPNFGILIYGGNGLIFSKGVMNFENDPTLSHPNV